MSLLSKDSTAMLTTRYTAEEIRAAEQRLKRKLGKTLPLPSTAVETPETFKQLCHFDAQRIQRNFTEAEQIQIGYMPLIISHLAWKHVDETLFWAKHPQCDATKKLSRRVQKCKDGYEAFIRQDLDDLHYKSICWNTDKFYDAFLSDFKTLYNAAKVQVMKFYADRETMRTNAFISCLLIDAVKEQNRRIEQMLLQRLNYFEPIKTNPYMLVLQALMEAFVGEVKLKPDFNIKIGIDILFNNLSRIEFDIHHEEA
jgi:hypothetical protein